MAKSSRRPRTRKSIGSVVHGDKCFVIMPFGGWFDKYFESIFQPGIAAAGLKPLRSDDLYRPSAITHDIWSMTKQAKVVLADLTGRNPNVFYELGLAHAIAKPAVLVTETLDDVPFDLQSLRVITYDKNVPDWGDLLTEKLTQALKETVDSPARSVLPTFLQTLGEEAKPILSRQDRELLEVREEIAALRRLVVRQSDVERRPLLRPDEARDAIKRYMERGYPSRLIIDRLVTQGVPRDWIEREMEKVSRPPEKFSKISETSAPPPSATPPEKSKGDEKQPQG